MEGDPVRKILIALFSLASFGLAHAADPLKSMADARDYTPLSIAINGAKGTTFRLIYTLGSGWEFADAAGPKLVSVNQQERPIDALPTGAPQSVFVDGPSGYVFVHVMDQGWRFVGSVSDAKR